MNTSNQLEANIRYDAQIEQVENEIRELQSAAPTEDIESMSADLIALLDGLFIKLHTLIALKCVTAIEPENSLMLDAISTQQSFNLLDVARLAQSMSTQIEHLHEALSQASDGGSMSQIKQVIAEFFIARQLLVDAVINDSSEADYYCECKTCNQSSYHQFTAGFDFVCTKCETPFFS